MEDDDYRKYGTSRAAHIDIPDRHVCFVCGAPVFDNEVVCSKCGFPQNGDETDQRRFLGELRVEKKYEALAAYRVGHAFNLLLVIPFALFYLSLVFWQKGSFMEAQVCGLFGVAFSLIWLFGRKKPYRAFLLSLVLYAVITLPLFVYKPSILFNTHFWIIMPYVFLLIGLYSFKDWKTLDDKLKGKNTG